MLSKWWIFCLILISHTNVAKYGEHRLDPSPENWEGKRGACIGVLYNWLTKSSTKGRPSTSSAAVTQKPSPLNDIITLLRNSSNPQADTIIKTLRKHVAAFK